MSNCNHLQLESELHSVASTTHSKMSHPVWSMPTHPSHYCWLYSFNIQLCAVCETFFVFQPQCHIQKVGNHCLRVQIIYYYTPMNTGQQYFPKSSSEWQMDILQYYMKSVPYRYFPENVRMWSEVILYVGSTYTDKYGIMSYHATYFIAMINTHNTRYITQWQLHCVLKFSAVVLEPWRSTL
jgi:hypothetical protein